MGNHHSAVCMKNMPSGEAPPRPREWKTAEANRGSKRDSLIEESVKHTSTIEAAGIDALKDKIEELKEQIESQKPPKEPSDIEKDHERLTLLLCEDERLFFQPKIDAALAHRDRDQMKMIEHMIQMRRTKTRRQKDFSVLEHTFGFVAIPRTSTQLAVMICFAAFVFFYGCCLIMGFTSPYYTCGYHYGVGFEDRICKPVDAGKPDLRRALILVWSVVALIASTWINVWTKFFVGELLVKHTFSFNEVSLVDLVCHDINNRHPMFRYGKTLEKAHPMRVQHDVQFFMPALRRPLASDYIFSWLRDMLIWKILGESTVGCFQEAHQFWRPVDTHAVRGPLNLNHVFSVNPRDHANQLGMFFNNLGPSLEGCMVDVTRFDAFSSLPNIAASKTWEDMTRNVEIAVKTCNWTAENWRFYESETPMALTNLLAYKWLATLYRARRVLRHDYSWAF